MGCWSVSSMGGRREDQERMEALQGRKVRQGPFSPERVRWQIPGVERFERKIKKRGDWIDVDIYLAS